MLEFNPYFRPSAKQLLQNKIFDAGRIPELEELSIFKIRIKCDNEKNGVKYKPNSSESQ
jgi:hypothetical protein